GPRPRRAGARAHADAHVGRLRPRPSGDLRSGQTARAERPTGSHEQAWRPNRSGRPAVKAFSKLCDAADWFDPEFDRIVRAELEDPPRLHRKQWEFAQIFRALQGLGRLNPQSRGLSMG